MVGYCSLMLELRSISRTSAILGSDSPQSNNRNCRGYWQSHPTPISGHNIIGFFAVQAVWYIDITEDIVAFVLAEITSCAQGVKYFVKLFGSSLDRFSGYQSSRNGELQKKN